MENPAPGGKAGAELDKFKRRLIRSVARLLLQEKKPEEEIWKELKKETGCDCELLWTRMRNLTLKKLERLLTADDCMDAVPKPARMSLTDWLLFDLVLVHQKTDLIGQNLQKTDDFPALIELFELVRMYKLEHLRGEQLAEAWSLATLTYNNKGHHCSPMLLQRRWYQLKQATRTKFYEYWYTYRGSVHRINLSEPYKPSPLQTEIASTFKHLITKPFLSWEDLVEKGKVTMPDEFEKHMKERVALRRPVRSPKQFEDVPDIVMIEPNVETIDLRLVPDDDANEENKQEEGGIPVPPLSPIVKIKQEPLDDMDIDETQVQLPKKSIYEVVLESTALEDEQIDSMDTEDFVTENDDEEVEEIKEIPARDEEESSLPQIGSVFGNVNDTSVLANIDEDRVYSNAENTAVCGNDNYSNVVDVDHTYFGKDKNAGEVSETIVLDDVEDSARKNAKETAASHSLDENSVQNNDEVNELSEKDKDAVNINDTVDEVCENVDEGSPVDGDNISVPGDVNFISDDDDNNSGVVDASPSSKPITEDTNVNDTVDKTSVTGTIDETTVAANVHETSTSDNFKDASEPAASEDEAVLDAAEGESMTAELVITSSPDTDSPCKDLEIIDTASDPVVIVNSDAEGDDIVDNVLKAVTKNTVEDIIRRRNDIDQPMKIDLTPEVISSPERLKVGLKENAVTAEDKEGRDVKPDVTSFNFGELPIDITFADDGIEFVDDGIIYVDEDGPNEPNIKIEAEDEDTPKIDAKLLMCPIVYTTRLDDMYSFHRQPFYHIKDKHLLEDIAKKSKPIKQEPKETVENVTVNYVGENIESVTVNNTKTIEHVQKNVGTIEKVAINNDTIVIIKKENVKVDSETSADIEHDLENDDNVTSDDGDCDENVIDESQKVKPTSYLLQKPRSRRYNPIQLCKNPDFNTRLKRLSVGFFSSPRNRVLIKSCKPLTIDLSKTFESKLVSGTLYLKPVDHNLVTEIRDDTESQNVSVLPSAMPAQSLIDNSKVTDILPMLRQCLEASKQTQDLGATTERNKVINLPDITEIRRINQRLLTAEVTPIQVHNNQPQVPVTIVTSLNSPSTLCTAQKTVTIPETEQDLRSVVTEANDARGPPKLLDITDDSPAKSSTDQYPTTTPSNNLDTRQRVQPSSNNTFTSTVRNTFDTFRPQAPGQVAGRPPRMLNGRKYFPPKPPVWKPRQLRPEIPWLTRTNEVSVDSMMNETLLTMDALNKMLFLLTKNLDLAKRYPKPKVKRKNAAQQTNPQRERPKTNPENPNVMLVPAQADKTSENQNTCSDTHTSNKMSQKPKINIKAATNYPPDKEKSDDNLAKKKVTYCCWARQRMLQLLFGRATIPAHECPRLCACCCRHLLADYITQNKKIQDAEMLKKRVAGNPFGKTKNTKESEDSKTCSPGLCVACIQNPVETPAQGPAVKTVLEDTPAIYVDATNTESVTKAIIENEPISIDDTEDDVPALGGEVSVKTTAVVSGAPRGSAAPVTVRRCLVTVPIVKNHNLTLCETPEAGKPAYRFTRCISSDGQPGGRISIISNATKTPITKIVPNISSPPSLSKFLEARKLRAPNKFNKSMPLPTIFNKPFVPPKNFKEKMIFLNSKQISEKPTASPVYLGKNKILLTTVKFPPNLRLFQETKNALRHSFNLPIGVHLILLANGTISYKIDPNVEVKATDMAELLAIIATVQEHMDEAALEEEPNKQQSPLAPVATESEVVDLVDDEDDASSVNEHQNTETTPTEESVTTNSDDSSFVTLVSDVQPTEESVITNSDDSPDITLVSKVQLIEESVTINSDDSPDVSFTSKMDTYKETGENPAAENINSNVIDIATESNQNETADQCTVINIQENIQDSSPNEIVSASTEQVECDTSIEKVSAEIDDQSKPSSQTESTHVPEESAKQVQDQSKPSGQNVSIELQDHPDPTIQNVTHSTEVPEESRCEPSKNKTKNILSDLMEMSGIFDEDITPEVEENVPAKLVEQVTLAQDSSVTPLPAPENEQQPVQEVMVQPASVVTPMTRSMLIPSFNANSVPPKVSSPLGELTPITSLYELKYACANKGAFFKLDFKTGFLVPINVCMKPAAQKPLPPKTSRIAPKSVIDLTDDDDKQQQKDKQLDNSPTKKSISLVNNSPPGGFAGPVKSRGFSGPVKPVKLFKALKPSILKRLNTNKMKRDSLNHLFDRHSLDHSLKRKQFLKNINMNADLSTKPVRRYIRKTKVANEAVNKPTATSSEPAKEFATTILSDDDSSDDEPLAKKAKRKNETVIAPDENRNIAESVTNNIELESLAADVEPEASVEKQIESELPVADDENNMIDDDLVEGEAPVDELNDAELLEADPEPVYMSDDDNDFTDHETTFGFDVNDSNEEDCCILGV